MIAGFDSSFARPAPDIAAAAAQAGIRVWGGYLGSRDGLGLATRWSQADFAVVQNAGLTAVGFSSGYDDPDWIRTTAQAWGILPCVDVETGIRPDGSWLMPWVQQAQAGLYGAMSVHYQTGEPAGRGAAFNVLAWYPGRDPGATWFDAVALRPPGPCAWQWLGDHVEFGLPVDRSWFDDWFIPAGTGRGGFGLGLGQYASDGDLVALHHMIQLALFGQVDPSGQQDFVNTVRAGVPLNSIYDGWAASQQSQDYQAALRSLVAVEGQVAHLQTGAASGVDPGELRAVLAKLAADQQQVLNDLTAASQDPKL